MRRFLAAAFLTLSLGATAVAGPVKSLPEAARKALDLSTHAGHVVYLDFWASWCKPCRHSFPWLEVLKDRYAKRGLDVVTVNVDRDRKAAEAFLADLNSDLDVVWDPDGKIAGAFDLEAMPSSYIFDRDGTLRDRHVGFDPKTTADVERELESLLAEGGTDAK